MSNWWLPRVTGRFFSVVGAWVLLCFTLAQPASANSAELFGKPQVLVTIKPVHLMVEALVGDSVQIEQLGAASANPHAVALSLKERQQVNDATVIIWLGERFERQLAPLIRQAKQPVIALGGISTQSSHPQDLHLWLAPANVSAMLEVIAAELSAILPLQAGAIQSRLSELKSALTRQQEMIAAELAPFQSRGFIVNHDAFRHWASAFKLNQVAAVSQLPEQQLGAKQRFDLQRQAAAADCLIVEANDQGGQRLASALHLPAIEIDPLGRAADIQSLEALFTSYLEGFKACFKASQ